MSSTAKMAGFQIPSGKMLIDGKWCEAASGKYFDTYNPATGEVLGKVAEGAEQDIDRAVRAARKAFEEGPWPQMSATERGKLLYKLAEAIREHGEELARIETLNCGKPISDARNIDVALVADCFEYYAGWANKIHGETVPVSGPFFNYTLREPVGVIGQIVAWNFPMLLAAWKLAPALATGNTVVLKPAEQTPLTALRLGELCLEAGFPPGVVNVVPGFGQTAGAALVAHRDVDKIAFTGEYITGQIIMREAAGTLKRLSLELGGKSPNIVFSDADVDAAVAGSMAGIFWNQGEVCCAGSRLFLQESIHDQFVEKLVAQTKKMKVGDPLQPDTQVGALVSSDHFNKVMSYIKAGKEEGAKLLTGGDQPIKPGYFVSPTVFDGVRDDMKIAREEIFGPVLSVIRFRDVDEVVSRANNTFYGLAAAVWTRDVAKAHTLARKLKAGTVWVNTYNVISSMSPFGGYKMSGFGRELGMHALELYTQVKSVWVNMAS
ncbi:MAG: betaine-aldehyde dehydrogenase [Acidobacteriia bacterium]|nr:betaine-aldehyde dehydrogenase [Terriglobia bacterium]